MAEVSSFVSWSSLSQHIHNCSAFMQLSVNVLRILLYLVSKSMARASSSSSKSISSSSSKSSSGKSRASHSSFRSWKEGYFTIGLLCQTTYFHFVIRMPPESIQASHNWQKYPIFLDFEINTKNAENGRKPRRCWFWLKDCVSHNPSLCFGWIFYSYDVNYFYDQKRP